jgi:hypothetical protein
MRNRPASEKEQWVEGREAAIGKIRAEKRRFEDTFGSLIHFEDRDHYIRKQIEAIRENSHHELVFSDLPAETIRAKNDKEYGVGNARVFRADGDSLPNL